MSVTFDIILRNGTVVTPGATTMADVAVKDGTVAAIGHDLQKFEALEEVDCRGLHVLPGIIDSQVHFREPGLEHKEDLATGTASAALGGITTIFEMPNTKPGTTTAEALAEKLQRAKGRAWVDHAFFLGATPTNWDHLAEWERMPGCSGVKIFMGSSTGDLLVDEETALRRVLAAGKRRVAVHCEDETRLKERRHLVDGGAAPVMHPEWRDVETARLATERLLRLAEAVHRRVHVLHVTTAEEMALLRHHKRLATCEVTPQHLTLVAPDCYERLGTYAQMNPPIRDERHRKALWLALNEGVVDCIGSDHAPHTREEKDQPYPASPSGMTGVQTLVPIMLDHVNAGRLTLERFVDLTAAGAARVFGISGKGRIAVGYDADFTIVDMKAQRRISNSWIASRCGWTPFDGMKVTGWPIATIIRGQTVMREDQLVGDAVGAPVRFLETY